MLLFDASTLILLAKTELLDSFLSDFPAKVVITKGVEQECCRKEEALDSLVIRERIKEKRIAVVPLRGRSLFRKLKADLGLGDGEAETLALALRQKNKIVAIDDRRGIKACKLLKIPFTSAIDMLVVMKEKQLLTREQALLKLAALAQHGRYAEKIIAKARSNLEAREK